MLLLMCALILYELTMADIYQENITKLHKDNADNLFFNHSKSEHKISDRIVETKNQTQIHQTLNITSLLKNTVFNLKSTNGINAGNKNHSAIAKRSSRRVEEITNLTTDSNGLESNDTVDEWGFDERAREDGYSITTPEESPYAVLLYIKGSGTESLCSGSLLTSEWVLTAAHCLQAEESSASEITIYAGGNSMEEIKEMEELPDTAQKLDAEAWYPHPQYKQKRGEAYDVGVVKARGEFEITKTVQPIRLSTKPWTDVGYRPCRITGFGKVYYKKKSPDDYKRKTHHLLVKNPCKCNFRLKQMVGKTFAMRYICSKPKQDYGVCSGDSGGGLVCRGKIRGTAMMLIKMVDTEDCELDFISRYKCGSERGLTVFQDTCPYLRWINSHVDVLQDQDISPECIDNTGHTLRAAASASLFHSALMVVYSLF